MCWQPKNMLCVYFLLVLLFVCILCIHNNTNTLIIQNNSTRSVWWVNTVRQFRVSGRADSYRRCQCLQEGTVAHAADREHEMPTTSWFVLICSRPLTYQRNNQIPAFSTHTLNVSSQATTDAGSQNVHEVSLSHMNKVDNKLENTDTPKTKQVTNIFSFLV